MFNIVFNVLTVCLLAMIFMVLIDIALKLMEIKRSVGRDRLLSVLQDAARDNREKSKERDDEITQILKQINEKLTSAAIHR